jgi:hypothetical protein
MIVRFKFKFDDPFIENLHLKFAQRFIGLTMGKSKKGSGFSRSGPVSGKSVTLFGRQFANIATATSGSTQTGLVLHPSNLSNRFVEMMDMFEQWRWKKMAITIFPNGILYQQAVAVVPTSNVTTQPTTFTAVTQFDTFRVLGKGQTVPVRFGVPYSTLRGDTNWYDGSTNDYCCVAYFSTADAVSGSILAVSSTITYMIEAEIEFKGASDPNVTLSRLKSRFFQNCDEIDSEDDSDDPPSSTTSVVPVTIPKPRANIAVKPPKKQ